jgi:hypothetical protein
LEYVAYPAGELKGSPAKALRDRTPFSIWSPLDKALPFVRSTQNPMVFVSDNMVRSFFSEGRHSGNWQVQLSKEMPVSTIFEMVRGFPE